MHVYVYVILFMWRAAGPETFRAAAGDGEGGNKHYGLRPS